MVYREDPSFALMLGLLIAFGVRHPPSADDSAAIGPVRYVLGWLTLGFVIIGFTPIPFTIEQPAQRPAASQEAPLQVELESPQHQDNEVQGRVWTIPMREIPSHK